LYSLYAQVYGNGTVPVYPPQPPPFRPPVDPTDLSRRKEVSQDDRPLGPPQGPPPFTAIERQQREAEYRRGMGSDRGSISGDNGRYNSPANDRSFPMDNTQRSGGSPVVSSAPPPAPPTPRIDSPARERTPIDH